jgi:cytochrome P450
MREVHRYVRAMIGRARERMRDEPAEAARNFLEAMIRLRDTPGSDITDDEVVANIITLLLAGEDTTANSIAWALFYLATDPPLQQRLAERARQVLGAAPVCSSYNLLKELDLFEAVCTEASRLRPIIWGQIFQPVADVCLADTLLPAGTGMILLNRPAMLDARNFSEPQRFDPERWLPQRCPHDRVHESRAYLQFGAGPRICPGRHLASIQMKLVLSMLMANFSMRLAVDPATIQEHCAFTVTPSAMPMHLMPRA